MKKLYLAVFSCVQFYAGFAQIPLKAITEKQVPAKDTTRKAKKVSTVPVSTMSNTVEVQNTDTSIDGKKAVKTNYSEPSNPNNNQPTPTLDELNQKIKSLQASIDDLNKRIPFRSMAYFTLVADQNNLEGATAEHPDRYKSIRIDHPLCNGNPKAKIFVLRETHDHFDISSVYYTPADGYWHLFPSAVSNIGTLGPLEVHYINVQNNGGQDVPIVVKDYDNFEDYIKKGSFLWAYPTILKPGDAIQLLIFIDLPNYNPAIYQKAGKQ